MTPKRLFVNPFVPKSPAGSDRFAGRGEELEVFEQCLIQCAHGTNTNIIYQGERGIGKTALITILRQIALGEMSSPLTGNSYNFNCALLRLNSCKTQEQIILRLSAALEASVDCLREEALIKKFANIMSRFKVASVAYENAPPSAKSIEDLKAAFLKLVTSCVHKDFVKQGLVLLIDEADAPDTSAEFGDFLKSTCEDLIAAGCNNVIFALAGLPELRQILKDSHLSTTRMFQTVELDCLSELESREVIEKCVKLGNKINGIKTKITTEAVNEIVRLSEGYPHFLQQFGYCAYKANADAEDDVITLEDVQIGAHHPKSGAIAELGKNFFDHMYNGEIMSDNGRAVLDVMAAYEDGWVKRSDIAGTINISRGSLDRALKRMTDKKIIIKDRSKQGMYRLRTKSFAVWIKNKPAGTPLL